MATALSPRLAPSKGTPPALRRLTTAQIADMVSRAERLLNAATEPGTVELTLHLGERGLVGRITGALREGTR